MADLGALKQEQAKREAALQEVSEKVAAIEAAEQKEREEQERKARELDALREKLEVCRALVGSGFVQRKIDETLEAAERQADGACRENGRGNLILSLFETSQNLLAWERASEILTEQAARYESQIQTMEEAQ